VHAHAHTSSIGPATVGSSVAGVFGTFLSSAVAINLMPPLVTKRAPLRPIFRVWSSQKSLGARSREYGGWVMTQQAMCGSLRCRDAEVPVPACPLSRCLLRTASRNLRENCSNALSRRYELMAHQTADVDEFRELFDCPSYITSQIFFFSGHSMNVHCSRLSI
jgi:hypothetical protein